MVFEFICDSLVVVVVVVVIAGSVVFVSFLSLVIGGLILAFI